MFIYSVKSSRLKAIALVSLVIIAVFVMFYLSKGEQPTANDGGISLKAATAEERVAFLSQFGWEIDEEPAEVSEVVIPIEFNSEYERYNALQKMQNFDLSVYSGKRVKQYTYTVLNYPGYDSADCIRASLLVYDGLVIGGDVSSLEQNGFMQTFDFPSQEEPST